MPRRCLHCSHLIPSDKRGDARFCKASCRIAYHRNRSLKADELERIKLNRFEAGLLIDSAIPWHPACGAKIFAGRWDGDKNAVSPLIDRMKEEWRWASMIRKAAYRLAARGLVRIGTASWIYKRRERRLIIERTELGSQLLAKRHNELHAIAEHVGCAADCEVTWRERDIGYEERAAGMSAYLDAKEEAFQASLRQPDEGDTP